MTASTPMGNWTSAAVATTANSSGGRAVSGMDADDAAVTHHEIITDTSAVSRDGQGVPGVNVIAYPKYCRTCYISRQIC